MNGNNFYRDPMDDPYTLDFCGATCPYVDIISYIYLGHCKVLNTICTSEYPKESICIGELDKEMSDKAIELLMTCTTNFVWKWLFKKIK